MLEVNIFSFLDIIKKGGIVGASGIDFDYFLTSEEKIDACIVVLFYNEVKSCVNSHNILHPLVSVVISFIFFEDAECVVFKIE